MFESKKIIKNPLSRTSQIRKIGPIIRDPASKRVPILTPLQVARAKEAATRRASRQRQLRDEVRQHIKQLRGQGVKGRAKLRKLKAERPLYKELAK